MLRILESKTEIAQSTGAENVLRRTLEPGTTFGDVLAGWFDDLV